MFLFRLKPCGVIKGKHLHKCNRGQHFLLRHLWFGVKATTNPGTRALQQELHGKCSLPSGLAIPAVWEGLHSAMLMKSPALCMGRRGTSLSSTYGHDLTLDKLVAIFLLMSIDKRATDCFPEGKSCNKTIL